MFTVEQLQTRSHSERRAMIRPRTTVQARTQAQKNEVARVARMVIAEHYDVLVKLKNR